MKKRYTTPVEFLTVCEELLEMEAEQLVPAPEFEGCEPENFVDPENWVYVVRAAEESGCLDLIAYRGEQAVALDPYGNVLCWSANDQDIGETDAEQLIIAAHCVA